MGCLPLLQSMFVSISHLFLLCFLSLSFFLVFPLLVCLIMFAVHLHSSLLYNGIFCSPLGLFFPLLSHYSSLLVYLFCPCLIFAHFNFSQLNNGFSFYAFLLCPPFMLVSSPSLLCLSHCCPCFMFALSHF